MSPHPSVPLCPSWQKKKGLRTRNKEEKRRPAVSWKKGDSSAGHCAHPFSIQCFGVWRSSLQCNSHTCASVSFHTARACVSPGAPALSLPLSRSSLSLSLSLSSCSGTQLAGCASQNSLQTGRERRRKGNKSEEEHRQRRERHDSEAAKTLSKGRKQGAKD